MAIAELLIEMFGEILLLMCSDWYARAIAPGCDARRAAANIEKKQGDPPQSVKCMGMIARLQLTPAKSAARLLLHRRNVRQDQYCGAARFSH